MIVSAPSSLRPTTALEELWPTLERDVPTWYPHLRRGTFEVAAAAPETGGTASRVAVTITARGGDELHLIVKRPGEPPPPARGGRPSPRPGARPEPKHLSEYRTLQLLHDRRGIHGVAAVRPVAHRHDLGAFVLERLDATPLDALLSPSARRRRGAAALEAILRNTGLAVRQLHSFRHGVEIGDGAAFARELVIHVHHLRAWRGDTRSLAVAGALAPALAAAVDAAPVGLQHGDLAPRNVLVTPAGEAALIDMLAAYRRTVAADLAFMRASLGVTLHRWPAPPGRRAALLATWWSALLDGYTQGSRDEAAVLSPAVDLMEVLALLDRWSAVLHRAPRTISTSVRRGRLLRAIEDTLDARLAAIHAT